MWEWVCLFSGPAPRRGWWLGVLVVRTMTWLTDWFVLAAFSRWICCTGCCIYFVQTGSPVLLVSTRVSARGRATRLEEEAASSCATGHWVLCYFNHILIYDNLFWVIILRQPLVPLYFGMTIKKDCNCWVQSCAVNRRHTYNSLRPIKTAVQERFSCCSLFQTLYGSAHRGWLTRLMHVIIHVHPPWILLMVHSHTQRRVLIPLPGTGTRPWNGYSSQLGLASVQVSVPVLLQCELATPYNCSHREIPRNRDLYPYPSPCMWTNHENAFILMWFTLRKFVTWKLFTLSENKLE